MGMTPEEHAAIHRKWEDGDAQAAFQGLKPGDYVRAWSNAAVFRVVKPDQAGALHELEWVSFDEWAALPEPKPTVKSVGPLIIALMRGRA